MLFHSYIAADNRSSLFSTSDQYITSAEYSKNAASIYIIKQKGVQISDDFLPNNVIHIGLGREGDLLWYRTAYEHCLLWYDSACGILLGMGCCILYFQ